MTRKTLAIITAAVILLGAMGADCGAAPKSQCQDGSTKVQVVNGKSRTYQCENGEWVKR